jgi:threonine dehydrogenase-like Zn-dependent dehydrogenase
MHATVMYGAGDVRIETVPDVGIVEPTDALIAVTHACICGSDLWPYKSRDQSETGRPMGHEAVGVVEAVGADVRTLKVGDVVVMPFAYSEGSSGTPMSVEHRPKLCVSRRRTERSSSCRSARTMP